MDTTATPQPVDPNPATANPLAGQAVVAGVTAPTAALPGVQPPVKRNSPLAELLGNLEEAPSRGEDDRHTDRLVQARLGLASSLFTALRQKHAPTAQHCLRVSLRCSSIASAIQERNPDLAIDDDQIDDLEIAALLHDIGKIGVPDRILNKPGPLTEDEVEVMSRHRPFGIEILAACCGNSRILDIVKYSNSRYDGRYALTNEPVGDELPLGSRILAISDAYDAMTTDHVYRRALPQERAIAELFENAGGQFDPMLVREFAKVSTLTEAQINHAVVSRWIKALSPESANALWHLRQPLFSNVGRPSADTLFQQKLLDAMHDGVIFVDANERIVLWNQGAERLSGISPSSVYEKTWCATILDMRDQEGNLIRDRHCPVHHTIQTGVQTLRRVSISKGNRSRNRVTVDLHVVPVMDDYGRCHGATLLMHDCSSEESLEERVQNLHKKATKDALTQVANRAEFDRVHDQFIETHVKSSAPCSLIICDIDRFKAINDQYGHQAGDAALVSFASLLQRSCRKGDLVARYGGEEFVMLCADCDNAAATQRAEEIRRELAQTQQPALENKVMTSSFGVTEVQLGDTPETMLRRADRALYQAKDTGRNRVVQLGTGIHQETEETSSSLFSWIRGRSKPAAQQLVERTLAANSPMNIVAEKVRGFISDHQAEIVSIEEDHVVLSIESNALATERRSSDRPTTMVIDLELSEGTTDLMEEDHRGGSRTMITVKISPKRNRDRRGSAEERAQQLFRSLKSYLIAHEINTDDKSK